ncbi:MAG: indolepyruvate ferredoxin oxidoreductase subunit beta [Methanomassiliicoccales archaeon]
MTFNILIVGVGGQGVLLASRVFGEAAMSEGHEVAMSEVHGMAQRGGSVSAVVRFGRGTISPLIPKAGADLILGFEPVETYRALQYANENTMIVTDVQKIIPITVTAGSESYPEVEKLITAMRDAGFSVLPLEATRLAEKAGSKLTVNSVLIGAVSALKGFPLSEESLRSALIASVPEKAKKINEQAFDLGREAVKL